VCLLPEYEDDNQKRSVLEGCFSALFEEVLAGWWTVVDDWPNTKDYQTFAEWFDVKMYSMVCDVAVGGGAIVGAESADVIAAGGGVGERA
jgi:hypothetical protein